MNNVVRLGDPKVKKKVHPARGQGGEKKNKAPEEPYFIL
jgi:hypothetical protein